MSDVGVGREKPIFSPSGRLQAKVRIWWRSYGAVVSVLALVHGDGGRTVSAFGLLSKHTRSFISLSAVIIPEVPYLNNRCGVRIVEVAMSRGYQIDALGQRQVPPNNYYRIR